MPELLTRPPFTPIDDVVDSIHGVNIPDPYRWLEDGTSPQTRDWLERQNAFTREYLDRIDGREKIKCRMRQFLEIETYHSPLLAQHRYVFRKRLPYQEQPCIYRREGIDGPDELLIDPVVRGWDTYTAIKPLAISPDARILAYEVKQGGERTSRVELFDMDSSKLLSDALPHGYLRAFAFAPDSRSFYYAVEPLDQAAPFSRLLYQHTLGERIEDDRVIFDAGNAPTTRLGLVSGKQYQLILVQRVTDRVRTDCYMRKHNSRLAATCVLRDVDYCFTPQFADDRILIHTDLDAPNGRIVELRLQQAPGPQFVELVPTTSSLIQQWIILRDRIVVLYLVGTSFKICVFDLFGKPLGELLQAEDTTISLIHGCCSSDELHFVSESFFQSPSIHRYSITTHERRCWSKPAITLNREIYGQREIQYYSKDGTVIPMFLVGRYEVLDGKQNPAILTSYGGFRTSMTPQFSVFVAYLMERGCLFALPNIRGGGEFGAEWHLAATRQKKQKAFDDFLYAAQWLINSGVASPDRIAIFGGSNSGLLVGVALTQAPTLFRAVVCIAPLLDMLRYHLFDGAAKWKEEFGTSEVPEEFLVLRNYSPYHRLSKNVSYPAVMMVSGDADQNCNPLHARKMIALLQAASNSPHPIILDYNPHRGHVPVLPLSVRVDALTDRVAFVCNELGLGHDLNQ